MTSRLLSALALENPGLESAGETRQRLREHFPRGAVRRMTQLGMLVGRCLQQVAPQPEDAVIYCSHFAESCALEGFLESFPNPSPTLFQTSIHPSAVQQFMIAQARPVPSFLPLTGGAHLLAQGLLAALVQEADGVVFCGGEERGTWLLDHGACSERTFAFAVRLTRAAPHALARLAVGGASSLPGTVSLAQWFEALERRSDLTVDTPAQVPLSLHWL